MNLSQQIVLAKRALTVSAIILLGTSAAAFQGGAIGGNPGGKGGPKPDLLPKNKHVFPYGVQSFERDENVKVGDGVTKLPGWKIEGMPGMVTTTILETPPPLLPPGETPRRWLRVEDFGAIAGEGVTGPTLKAPAPWTYAWTFRFQLETAPSGVDAPVLAVQHKSGGAFQDAWGVRLLPGSAELYLTDLWGTQSGQTTLHLYDYTGTTSVGEWVNVRVVADLAKNTLRAFVNGAEAGMIRAIPPDTTDLTRLRFSYHGNGTGNLLSMLLDDVGVAFLNPLCLSDNTYDFTTEDDFATPLANGQQIDAGVEFGADMTISGSGPNNGAAIFDGTPTGPNDPGQDSDLLVGMGNMLILQSDAASNPAKVGDIYPRPNDDENGGSFSITFNTACTPLSIDLVDVDDGGAMTFTLTDFSGVTRTYSVPDEWTGDINDLEPGVGTLDLQTTLPQVGWASVATAVDGVGFDPSAVVSMTVDLAGSGALDNLHLIIPCVQLTFETEDDFTPVFTGTTLVNGQDISTPDEFNVEIFIADAGANAGSAIFDSTPGGPNALGADKDLLVGLGNILCLQNDLFSTQTVAGIFDTPNDDTQGGTITFTFPSTVHAHQITMIDADEEEVVGVTVTLLDSGGDTRTYTVPPGFTGDELNDGIGTGSRTLDLDTLLPQAGFLPGLAFSATAAEVGVFDADDVVSVTISLGGAQCIDNFCFCPCSCP